jgi:hypothetical protein
LKKGAGARAAGDGGFALDLDLDAAQALLFLKQDQKQIPRNALRALPPPFAKGATAKNPLARTAR